MRVLLEGWEMMGGWKVSSSYLTPAIWWVFFSFFFLVGFARPELSRDRFASERPLLLKCWSRVGNGYTLWQCHRLWYIEKVA